MDTIELVTFNKHLLVKDSAGFILLDTGSPSSFHKKGVINVFGRPYNVPADIMHVNASFLTDKVGCDISGLLGMDIIKQFRLHLCAEPFGGVLRIDGNSDNRELSSIVQLETFNLMGVPGVVITIDGRRARMLFDTGAPISYMGKSFLRGKPCIGQTRDFSPMTMSGEYTVNLYSLETSLHPDSVKDSFNVHYGNLPQEIALVLGLAGVDGIIGYDLLMHSKVILNYGEVVIPTDK